MDAPNCSHSLFIHIFQFDFGCTSYLHLKPVNNRNYCGKVLSHDIWPLLDVENLAEFVAGPGEPAVMDFAEDDTFFTTFKVRNLTIS
jgi:hypothetical protein